VGALALVLPSQTVADETFARVAAAAHLRIALGECSVAVETVTAPTGLVSYWGYIHRDRVIVVLTLDTLDPQQVSMSDFRALVTRASSRVESATGG
jgi:hypothetical protein